MKPLIFGVEDGCKIDDFLEIGITRASGMVHINGSQPVRLGDIQEDPASISPFLWKNAIENFQDDTAIRNFVLPLWELHGREIQYMNISDIPPDEKYVFYISMENLNYIVVMKERGLENLISDQVLADIRSGRAFLVLVMPYEGPSGMKDIATRFDFNILADEMMRLCIPPENMMYLSGNLISKQSAAENYADVGVDGICLFERWINVDHYTDPQPIKFEPSQDKNLFMCLNRVPKPFRLQMVATLFHRGLDQYGKISYTDGGNTGIWFNMKDPTIAETCEYISKHRPEQLLDTDTMEFNLADTLPLEMYSNTFMYLNTETFGSPGTVFFSEKVFKPLFVGMPFVLLGNPGSLDQLHQMGYYTFNQWWDESYDHEYDLSKRIHMICDIIEKLSVLNTDQLIDLRKQMKPVLQHNRDRFLKIHEEKYTYPDGFSSTFKPVVQKIRSYKRL